MPTANATTSVGPVALVDEGCALGCLDEDTSHPGRAQPLEVATAVHGRPVVTGEVNEQHRPETRAAGGRAGSSRAAVWTATGIEGVGPQPRVDSGVSKWDVARRTSPGTRAAATRRRSGSSSRDSRSDSGRLGRSYSTAVLRRAATLVADVCRRSASSEVTRRRRSRRRSPRHYGRRRSEPRLPEERPLDPGPGFPIEGLPRACARRADGVGVRPCRAVRPGQGQGSCGPRSGLPWCPRRRIPAAGIRPADSGP